MVTKVILFLLCFVGRLHCVKIVTFNTGLADSVDFYARRRAAIIPAIRKIDFDVMCLQEVFYGNDLIEIEASLGSHTTSLHMPLTQERGNNGNNEAPCDAAARKGSLTCMFTQCANLSQERFINCAFSTCRLDLESQSCITCLTLDARRMKTRCILDPGPMNIPGIILLSNRKVFSVKYEFFEDPDLKLLLPRGYISAEIAGVGTVICTHQTAFLGPVYLEYTLRELNIYSSWAEQNLAESKKLTALPKSFGRSAVIVGDINSSPRISTDITPLLQDSYQHYIDEGFTSPYVDIDGRCTFCADNPLANLTTGINFLLDHVLIKTGSHVINTCTRSWRTNLAAERFLEEIIPGTRHPKSDHFAVRVDIVPLRQRRGKRYIKESTKLR
ncbi:uncharacterized protein LOC117343491 [Pecten maximus]|uniref:uncharacterized protein LOC117343491 n=1 Tax=Pecten maximus TaxID=6579 RepID=UPI0014586DFF|nr:uncharacterized protein LOC117343491 [Pecten maximus]